MGVEMPFMATRGNYLFLDPDLPSFPPPPDQEKWYMLIGWTD